MATGWHLEPGYHYDKAEEDVWPELFRAAEEVRADTQAVSDEIERVGVRPPSQKDLRQYLVSGLTVKVPPLKPVVMLMATGGEPWRLIKYDDIRAIDVTVHQAGAGE